MSEKIYGQFDLETIEKLADIVKNKDLGEITCLLYTSPSPRD